MGDLTASAAQTTAKEVIGAKMLELAERDARVVVVNADLTRSSALDEFAERFPQRCFNVGIAEQQMVSFAAGLAAEGFMPFCFTFGPFLSMRAIEQIRTDVCYPGLPVRFIGANAGPLYLRTNREKQGRVLPEGTAFEFGRARVLRDGRDGAFLVSGVCVQAALEAAERLAKERRASVRVIDLASVRPLDEASVLDAVGCGSVVVAQDANIRGGLGYQVAAVMAQAGVTCKLKMLGCPDKYVPIATPSYLYHANGYDADGLTAAMEELL